MTKIETLKQEAREVLENNILRFWIDRMQDNEQGGFYGRIDNPTMRRHWRKRSVAGNIRKTT